jgi:ABC-type lipoprotein release transport system permease subunit
LRPGVSSSSNLVGVSPTDPVVLLATESLFLVACVGAALAPANRAARIDPISALRAE